MNGNRMNWDDIKLFLAVAETGSFSAAAKQLRLGQPTLSRRIAEFESHLDGPLFIRQSRGCELTELGQKLLPSAQQMAQWSVDALNQIQSPEQIKGKVRITAPPAISYALLTQFAAELAIDYPDIQLEILSGIAKLNLARGEADIALRTQPPEEDNLVLLQTFIGSQRVYVSHKLADSLAQEVKIEQLPWICWPKEYDYMKVNQALEQAIPDFTPAFTSDDFNVQMAACCSGVGAMVLPKGFEHSPLLLGITSLDIDLAEESYGELYMVVHNRQRYLPRIETVSNRLIAFLSTIWP